MRRILGTALLGVVAMATLSACSEGRGYGGVNVGVGFASSGYDDGYYGSNYGYGGWYDGFYYPGSGYYVYDRGGHRSRWNDNHRQHWEGRRAAWQQASPAQREAMRELGRQDRNIEGRPAWRGNRRADRLDNTGNGQPRRGFSGTPRSQVDAGSRAERGAARAERRAGRDGGGMRGGRERAPRTQPQ